MYGLNSLTTQSGRKDKILTDFEIIGNFDIHAKQKNSFIYKIKWDEMS